MSQYREAAVAINQAWRAGIVDPSKQPTDQHVAAIIEATVVEAVIEAAVAEINQTWFGRLKHLPHSTLDLIREPTDGQIAAIIEKHMAGAAKKVDCRNATNDCT